MIIIMINGVFNKMSANISVIVGVDAELNEWEDTRKLTEDRIVSQWKEISADEQRQLRQQIDEILRPFGLQTRLLVVERANSIAFLFLCMTLSELTILREQWSSRQLRDSVESLFTLLSAATHTVLIKRLSWPATDYVRCLDFFASFKGKPK